MFQVPRVLHCVAQSEEKSKSLVSYPVTVPSEAHPELDVQHHPFILLFFLPPAVEQQMQHKLPCFYIKKLVAVKWC